VGLDKREIVKIFESIQNAIRMNK
jgi:hypothetical protein